MNGQNFAPKLKFWNLFYWLGWIFGLLKLDAILVKWTTMNEYDNKNKNDYEFAASIKFYPIFAKVFWTPLALNEVCQDQTNYYRVYATDVLNIIAECSSCTDWISIVLFV